MKRPFTLAAAVLGIAIPLVATPGAHAAAGSPPQFRAAVDTWSYDIEGTGVKAGWHYRESMKDATMVLPSYAEKYRLYKSYFQGGKPRTFSDQYVAVGGRSYEKVNNTPRWKITKLTARQISYAQTYNPVIELDMFLSLPGVTQAGPGHYRVTCTPAQAEPYFQTAFGETAAALADNGIKAVTINFWADPAGRPVKDTATGRSATVAFSAAETFTRYNQPVHVTAPA